MAGKVQRTLGAVYPTTSSHGEESQQRHTRLKYEGATTRQTTYMDTEAYPTIGAQTPTTTRPNHPHGLDSSRMAEVNSRMMK